MNMNIMKLNQTDANFMTRYKDILSKGWIQIRMEGTVCVFEKGPKAAPKKVIEKTQPAVKDKRTEDLLFTLSETEKRLKSEKLSDTGTKKLNKRAARIRKTLGMYEKRIESVRE